MDEDIDSLIDSVLEEDTDIEQWSADIDKYSALTLSTNTIYNLSKVDELYELCYNAGASILGADRLDRILTDTLNSSSSVMSMFDNEDTVLVLRHGNLYCIQPLSTDLSTYDSSDEEIDGHTIGTVTD